MPRNLAKGSPKVDLFPMRTQVSYWRIWRLKNLGWGLSSFRESSWGKRKLWLMRCSIMKMMKRRTLILISYLVSKKTTYLIGLIRNMLSSLKSMHRCKLIRTFKNTNILYQFQKLQFRFYLSLHFLLALSQLGFRDPRTQLKRAKSKYTLSNKIQI